jgi:hypothetical protein
MNHIPCIHPTTPIIIITRKSSPRRQRGVVGRRRNKFCPQWWSPSRPLGILKSCFVAPLGPGHVISPFYTLVNALSAHSHVCVRAFIDWLPLVIQPLLILMPRFDLINWILARSSNTLDSKFCVPDKQFSTLKQRPLNYLRLQDCVISCVVIKKKNAVCKS